MKVLRESTPKQVDESGVPKEKKGVWGSQEGNRDLEFSRRRKGRFPPTFLNKDYITMHPAWGHFRLLEHLLSNPIILKCILWVWVWVVQSHSHVWLFATLWTAEHQVSLSPTPGVYTNSCPLSQWCHPTISSSVIPFSCPQSFPASGSFQMSQFFTSGGQSSGVSASTSVLPMNT